jgi:hypothetical protein
MDITGRQGLLPANPAPAVVVSQLYYYVFVLVILNNPTTQQRPTTPQIKSNCVKGSATLLFKEKITFPV